MTSGRSRYGSALLSLRSTRCYLPNGARGCGRTEEELQQLEELEVVVRDQENAAPHWRLRHATLREVAYASLSKRDRLRLHRNIAQSLLDSGHVFWAANHLELAARAALDLDPADRALAEQAADALLAAGDRARRRMDSRTAIDFYERGLALTGPAHAWGVREARLLAGAGEARYWLAEYATAREVLMG